jgi:hypothetical protein
MSNATIPYRAEGARYEHLLTRARRDSGEMAEPNVLVFFNYDYPLKSLFCMACAARIDNPCERLRAAIIAAGRGQLINR